MLNWAVSKRRIPYNPLESVSGVPFNEKRRNRRDLNEDEQRRLLEAGLSGSFRRAARMKANRPRKDGTYKQVEFSPEQTARLTAEGRRIRMFYFVLLETGLRVNEVRNLKWRDVDFRNQRPRIGERTIRVNPGGSAPDCVRNRVGERPTAFFTNKDSRSIGRAERPCRYATPYSVTM